MGTDLTERKKFIQNFSQKMKKRDHLGDQGIDGRVLKFMSVCKGMDWIQLAHDRV
jgi:hypothetical protein